MSETLTDFLLARIAEDAAGAEKASEQCHYTWSDYQPSELLRMEDPPIYDWHISERSEDYSGVVAVPAAGLHLCHTCEHGVIEDAAQHITRWDPARVLAECKAKRLIVEAHEPSIDDSEMCGWPCATLLALATVYADHPDYLQEWAAYQS